MFWKKKKKSTANEGSGTKDERARSPHAVDWVSNAPSTWPVLQLEPLPSDNDALNTIMFGAGESVILTSVALLLRDIAGIGSAPL